MGLFDYLKDNVLRRGTDDPLFRKGMDKLNEVVGDRRRADAASRWPLASDPDGLDIFRPLLTDEWWALNHGRVEARDFRPTRVDSVDACGWHFGYGTQFLGFDIDGPEAAGGTTRYRNDLWIEVELTPSFNALELDARLRLLLDDHDSRYRRTAVPDDQPELQRYVHTGRFRPTGDWCAIAHLVPAVVSVRSDRQDMTRERAYQLMESLLERLDADAFVAWRSAVHEQNGTRHDPNLPPWRSGRPTGSPTEGDAPTRGEAPPEDPRPEGDPGGGRNTGDEQPAAPATFRLPTPEDIKVALDATPAGEPIAVDHEAVAAGLGGGIEKVRTIVLRGLGDGVRIQSPGGRAVDIVRVDDPVARRAIELGKLDGVRIDPPQEVAGYRYANLDDDTDHAVRGVLTTTADGAMYYVRVRGMKREDTSYAVRAVIQQLAG
jgi:hypothetical protein